jgi:Zn-dependent M28 family amino/carboxypeptidase
MGSIDSGMRKTLLLGLVVPAMVGAQAKQAGPIRPADLMRHMNVLAHDSLEGRAIGTPGSAKARKYLIKAFTDAGLKPLGASFESPFTAPPRGRGDNITTLNGVNLVGVIRGRTNPDKYIVVTAHYDHAGINNGLVYNGADDNASGTGALVEIARQLAARPPENSVLIVAFDGEERGLVGARAFVAKLPVDTNAIVMNVNMDMVGRNANGELYAAGSSYYPFLRPILDSLVTRSAIKLKIGHDDPNGPRQDDWTTQSDHGAFHAAKIPFIYFGVEDHPDYHKPTDDIAGIMPEFYAGVVNTVLEGIRMFDARADVILKRGK